VGPFGNNCTTAEADVWLEQFVKTIDALNLQGGSSMKKAFSLCLMICLVISVSSFSFAGDKAETVNGWITDAKCGAKGANAGGAACTKKCLEAGEKMVVVTDGDQKILNVQNPDALKGHEGHHVAVSGHVSGDSIHVMSVKML
jgi:hypothetical protein